jgi:SAM-dependent methyltransferase
MSSLGETRERLRPYVERARGFSGWNDFPAARALDSELPWNYVRRARDLAAGASRILDIGTGGGERLADIAAGLKLRCVATEEWPPNVPLARDRLLRLGFEVIHADDERLPFGTESFDLILNRHSALDPTDIALMLRPGGTLLTQQVGHDNWDDIRAFFPRKTQVDDHFERYRVGLVEAGLQIVQSERHAAATAYESARHFVYMLCVCPWEVPTSIHWEAISKPFWRWRKR